VAVNDSTNNLVNQAARSQDTGSASAGVWPLVKDYLLLTKPRVISLLLLTTWAAMFIAKPGWPGLGLFLVTGLGLFMSAGSAHVFNNVYDRDIDGRTNRTASRAIVAGRIPVLHAMIYGFALGIGSFLLLWYWANLLSACMALAGLLFYVFIYTMWLKRRTWSNIVIGGAAGAFPPLVGWTAVTGHLDWLGWLLFVIIFLWTPVHFWALAILIKDDYKENGIPMLPVVAGDRATSSQIIFYAIITTAASLLPLVFREGNGLAAGWLYGMAAILLNGLLMVRCVQLYKQPDRPHASKLFHYSMIYLALLFVALAVDRSFLLFRIM
jgi:protoheme IX farnesyltransferase